MNSYTFMLLIVHCGAMALQKHDDYYNVGTVLFSRSDLQKKNWNRREVQLLQARQYFQDLLPPPSFVSRQDRNGINSLLEYFKDAYTTVKREAKDVETDNIMTAAMSDLLGGYLKLWGLPITKLSFYGGTANQDDTLRLYDLYNEIKYYLNTNGKGWRNPNSKLLNSVFINVASPRTQTAREIHYPCDNLAFYEKTQSGFSIPMPSIEWRKDGETMFVPLKNESLIPLSSTNNSDSLFKYYETAKNCISDTERKDFDKKFETWLNNEVLPHLNDEKLYPALGSVLTLVNKTRHLCDTVIDIYKEDNTPHKPMRIAGIVVDFSSKKFIILSVIIFLEIAWCIPAVCYLICTKCNKKNKQSNVYMCVDHPKNKPPSRRKSEFTSTLSREMSCEACENPPSRSGRSQGLNYPSRHSYPSRNERWNYEYDTFVENEFSTQSLINKLDTASTEIRTTNLSNDFNELPSTGCVSKEHRKHHSGKIGVSKRIGTNKVLVKGTSTFSHPDFYNFDVPTTDNIKKPESYPTMQQLETTKTVTLLKSKDPDAVINRMQQIAKEEKDTQMCLPLAQSKCNQSIEKCSKTTMVTSNATEPKLIRTQTQKDLRKKGVRLVSGKPYLEITIDNRPPREITEHVSFDLSSQQNKHVKPSKIPKRTFNNSEAQTYRSELIRKAQNPLFAKRRSYLPLPKQQRTKDDLNIKDKKTSYKKSKLNTTF